MSARLRHYLEMIRFSHTVFALPFALMAAAMAWKAGWEQEPPQYVTWRDWTGVLLCMVFARSAAMSFNRLSDRDIDARNPRTVGRHLPAGVLTIRGVVTFAAICCIGFIISTLLFLPNRLPLLLSVPVLAFLLGYSYTKRFTVLAHFWLGAALMLAPISAWIAIRGEAVMTDLADLLPVVVLGGAVLFWVAGFDMIYACQDLDFDRLEGLHSIPARFGAAGALRVAAACHLVTIVCLWILPVVFPYLGWLYRTGTATVTVLLIYEHVIISPRELQRINQAFFQVNALISVGLFCFTSLDLLAGRMLVF